MSGDVLVVTSGKGGVGKTTTVVNLAIALRQHGHSVAVLDADLGMPDVGEFLSIDAKPTLHDVLAERADIEEATVEIGDGLAFVFGDTSLEGFAQADPAKLESVVEALADEYQCVLVDTGGGLTYETVFPMDLGDAVLLITSPVPAAIADTKKSKQVAERLDVPVCGVVVTHADGSAHPESVASQLDVDFLGSIPDDETIVESAAKRQPVVAYAPESAATVAYYRLAERIADEETATLDPLDTAAKPPEEVFESATDLSEAVDDEETQPEPEDKDGEEDTEDTEDAAEPAEPDKPEESDESKEPDEPVASEAADEPETAEGPKPADEPPGAGTEAPDTNANATAETPASDTAPETPEPASDAATEPIPEATDQSAEGPPADTKSTEQTPAEIAGGDYEAPEPQPKPDDSDDEDDKKGMFGRLLSRFR